MTKRAERKVISEQLCQTPTHWKLDKTRQLQFTRSLLKGARNKCWYRARTVLSTALSRILVTSLHS